MRAEARQPLLGVRQPQLRVPQPQVYDLVRQRVVKPRVVLARVRRERGAGEGGHDGGVAARL